MKFDFRTKLLVIVLTMSLVAVLTSDILIYTLLGVLSVYLIIQGFGRQTIKLSDRLRHFYRVEAAFRGAGHYHPYAGNVPVYGASYFDDGYGCTACDRYASRRSCGSF